MTSVPLLLITTPLKDDDKIKLSVVVSGKFTTLLITDTFLNTSNLIVVKYGLGCEQ